MLTRLAKRKRVELVKQQSLLVSDLLALCFSFLDVCTLARVAQLVCKFWCNAIRHYPVSVCPHVVLPVFLSGRCEVFARPGDKGRISSRWPTAANFASFARFALSERTRTLVIPLDFDEPDHHHLRSKDFAFVCRSCPRLTTLDLSGYSHEENDLWRTEVAYPPASLLNEIANLPHLRALVYPRGGALYLSTSLRVEELEAAVLATSHVRNLDLTLAIHSGLNVHLLPRFASRIRHLAGWTYTTKACKELAAAFGDASRLESLDVRLWGEYDTAYAIIDYISATRVINAILCAALPASQGLRRFDIDGRVHLARKTISCMRDLLRRDCPAVIRALAQNKWATVCDADLVRAEHVFEDCFDQPRSVPHPDTDDHLWVIPSVLSGDRIVTLNNNNS
jgi:hypothetical protein